MKENDSAKELFTKGICFYQQKNYQEAMNSFLESQKKCPNKGTAFYIGSCLKKLNSEGNTANKQLAHETTNDDIECEKILKTNNYYFLLQITKDSSPEIVKKSYRELAIKFHPDKNHSSKAEEAFKKIYSAYQTIINSEKREQYDKYGEDVDIKSKKTNTNANKGNKNVYSYCYHHQCNNSYHYNSNSSNNNNTSTTNHTHYYKNYKTNSYHHGCGCGCECNFNQTECDMKQASSIKQLLPIIIVCGLYLFVKLFKTVDIYDIIPFLSQEPLYQFEISSKYYLQRRTKMNNVEYFIGDAFIAKYPQVKHIDKSRIELVIEREFLLSIKAQCNEALRMKATIEQQITINTRDIKIVYELNNQLKDINYKSCKKYKEYSQIIQ